MDRAILKTIAAFVRQRVKREGLGAIDPGLRELAARVVSHHGNPAACSAAGGTPPGCASPNRPSASKCGGMAPSA
jgi:hypothetical protein